MNKFATLIGAIELMFFAAVAIAAPKPVHSNLEKKITNEASRVKIDLIVKPKAGYKVNDMREKNGDLQAPWRMTITTTKNISFPKEKLEPTDYVASLPGFSVASSGKPTTKSWSFSYKLYSYVCTKESIDQCFQEVHVGDVSAP